MLKTRNEVPKNDCWNVEALYQSIEDWEKDFQIYARPDQKPHWPEIAAFRGRLGESAKTLKEALESTFSIDRKLSSLYTYAHLRHDEDIINDQNKVLYSRIMGIMHDFSQEVSWFEPEILALPKETMTAFLKSPELAPYKFHLEKIIRVKPHMLSPNEEELLALAGKSLQASSKAFSAINDADFKFGTILDSKGEERPLTHSLYGVYLRDQDRTLRKNAFLQVHQKYMDYENTISELLQGQIQSHLFNARARKYPTCLEAALFPKNVEVEVYHSLITAVNDSLGSLHKYINLRKRLPGVDQLHLYDMYVPITAEIDIKMPYKEAEDLVIESVAPLGAEYQNALKKGFHEQRWVDRYENQNKRSGAYSSGCYDSMPYILMNYNDSIRDVFTLAHEAGHSMHSLNSHKSQPYHSSHYPIFLAEVASTFNEDLLIRLMLQRSKSKEETIYLLTQKIEDIRTTLFRQTMFAEFELFLHTMAEQNIPITPKLLRDEYVKLNQRYFGKEVLIDKEAEVEWARIPHFYYNFYVYQYATGISAALALSERVNSGGEKERNEYLTFLKSGGSKYPIEILQAAGVDMRSPVPVKSAISKFGSLVDQLEKLLK